MRKKRISLLICLILKYLFAMVFPILAAAVHKMNWRYIAAAAAEVVFTALLTQLLCHVKTWLGYVFNVLALLFMNIQFAVLYWGSTFVSAVMLANLDSVNAISGKFLVYGLSVAAVLAFTFLPVCLLPGRKRTLCGLGIATVILYAAVFLTGSIAYSPYHAVYTLCQQQMARNRVAGSVESNRADRAMSRSVSESGTDRELLREDNEFYSDSVADYISRPDGLSDKPNVILIFVEGMSQNIVEDARNIMPNTLALQERSISFSNYYNHTFATYMGLSGQLYSGYQRENYDVNYLVSIQDIFKDYGYRTSFINTEPKNREFSQYLANFGFDEVIADESRTDGMADALSDKAAYEMLFETALKQDEGDSPFFLAMYSFGTHATLDGVYEKFEDGSNALLNRFYDLDVQIGSFLEQFEESCLADDTVIILTSDHATYQDADYVTAFPDDKRVYPSLDQMPLMIYYQGAAPAVYDAGGRNSLDMAPTVLDFLDMTAPNSFLGESLFAAESGSLYDTYFESMGVYYCTEGGEISLLSAERLQEFEKQLARYYAVKLSDDLIYEEYEEAVHVFAQVNGEQTVITAELYNADTWDMISFALWSEDGGQDDLQWFHTNGSQENPFIYEIDLSGYDAAGMYYLHAYGSMEDDEEMTFLGETRLSINE